MALLYRNGSNLLLVRFMAPTARAAYSSTSPSIGTLAVDLIESNRHCVFAESSQLTVRTANKIREKRAAALMGGGDKRIVSQHKKGKLTARERLDVLLDSGSFIEYDQFAEHSCHDFNMQNEKVRSFKMFPPKNVLLFSVSGRQRCHWSRQDLRPYRFRL